MNVFYKDCAVIAAAETVQHGIVKILEQGVVLLYDRFIRTLRY